MTLFTGRTYIVVNPGTRGGLDQTYELTASACWPTPASRFSASALSVFSQEKS